MFGLFDKPATKIRKQLPQEILREFDELREALESSSDVSYLTPEIRVHYSVGFILSVWVNNSVVAGHFQLSYSDLQDIVNRGEFCHKMLGNGSGTAENLLERLIENGVVPKQNSDIGNQQTKMEEMEKFVRSQGDAVGDKRLGEAMAGALNDMTASCPKCGGPVWNEAGKCGHCGEKL